MSSRRNDSSIPADLTVVGVVVVPVGPVLCASEDDVPTAVVANAWAAYSAMSHRKNENPEAHTGVRMVVVAVCAILAVVPAVSIPSASKDDVPTAVVANAWAAYSIVSHRT